MAYKLSLVKGVKNEQGAFIAPENVQVEEVIIGEDAKHAKAEKFDAGTSVEEGYYFAGVFDDEAKHFVTELKAVPAFVVAGVPAFNAVSVEQTEDEDGQATIVAE